MSERSLAPFGRRLLTVTANEQLGAYRVLKVSDPGIPDRPGGCAPDPGQFAMLVTAKRWGAGEDERPYLPRAFSYARWLADRRSPRVPRMGYRTSIGGEAHFLLEDVGPGTQRLCELQAGEGLWLLGPLGAGFTTPRDGRRALLVGGGVGIAPLAIWQDTLDSLGQAGGRATVLLGFRDRAHAEGAALLSDAVLATDDGSLGRQALVTELLDEQLDHDPHATVYACGPPAMLEAVRALCEARAIPAQLALEAGMACGFGACFGCVVATREGGYLRVCVDGPVIDAQLLDHIDAHAGSPA